MGTPRRPEAPKRPADPDGDKRRALNHAGHTEKKLNDALAARDAAFRFAKEQGASLREIAEATGVPHMTVARIIERAGDA